MSYTTDLEYMNATAAIDELDNIGADTTPAHEPLERWNRVRDTARNARTPDSAELWEAVASGDQKAVTKAATAYMAARAILDAAQDSPRREDQYRVATTSTVKALIRDNLDNARALYNEAAQDYTEAFRAAGNRPDPSQLIVTDGGAEIWADLIRAAKDMTKAANIIKRAAEFGHKANDQGTGLGAQVPFATKLPDIQAVTRAKDTEWVTGQEHAPHREWAHFLIAGGELYAGTIPEQEAEVERLIDLANSRRKLKSIGSMISDEDKALQRAMKTARKAGRA